jgi:hypothetical protein
MITQEEGNRLRDIKARTLRKQNVTLAERQWVLTLLAREQEPVRADVVQRAFDAGFDVRGIVVL